MTPVAVLALFLQGAPAAAPSAPPSPVPAPAASPSSAPAPAPVIVRPSVEPVTPPPSADVIFPLVKQTTAFAADSGRTALRLTPTTPAQVPGVDDKGYFVEFQWTDKAGTTQTGVAVLAHRTVREVPWLVKGEGEWGLVQVMEGKPLPAMLDEVKRTRMAANEAVAVRDIRTLMSGEMIIMSLADGAYAHLECMHKPSECIVGIPDEVMLERSWLAAEKSGYRRTFHGGAPVTNAKAKGSPSLFVKTFAITAVPLVPGESGVRSFCGDHTGRVCVVADGSAPPVKDGACVTPCTEMK